MANSCYHSKGKHGCYQSTKPCTPPGRQKEGNEGGGETFLYLQSMTPLNSRTSPQHWRQCSAQTCSSPRCPGERLPSALGTFSASACEALGAPGNVCWYAGASAEHVSLRRRRRRRRRRRGRRGRVLLITMALKPHPQPPPPPLLPQKNPSV